MFDSFIILLDAKHNKWSNGGAGEQQLIKTDSQLCLLSTSVNILHYLKMLKLDKKSEFLSFRRHHSYNFEMQQVNKKIKRGAEKNRSDSLPLSPLHSCVYLQLHDKSVLELEKLLQDLFNVHHQSTENGKRDEVSKH